MMRATYTGPNPRGSEARGSEDGAVGGVEVLPFGLLIFASCMLIIVNLWGVVDAKMAVDAAAREAGRAFVEAPDARSARPAAERAANDAIDGFGRDPNRLGLIDNDPPFTRCAVVEHEATYTVPALSVPFLGGFGSAFEVRGRHRESIDAFREGLEGRGDCS